MPDKTIIEELQSITPQLLNKLQTLAFSAGVKYDYYNATQSVVDLGISLPKKFQKMKPGVGWASRAVNTLSDRINFDGFAKDRFGINDLLDTTHAIPTLEKAKNDALIAGCSFVAVLPYGDSVQLLPFTATEATGIMNQQTGLLKYGLAVTEWYPYDSNSTSAVEWSKVGLVPRNYIVFTPSVTAFYTNDNLVAISENATGRPMLHCLTHRQSADRPFGKARISNTVRRIIDEVGRLKVRYEIAAEFYSTPQRYINGFADGTIDSAQFESALGKIWAITKDEDSEHPEIGQLPQMSINQFSDQKKDLARDFCAETALTLRNLGYETANPTSAESLSAMSDDLLLEAQECQNEMGRQIKEIAISMRQVIDGNNNIPSALLEIEPTWKPVFQLDVGAAGDAAYKLLQAMPELAGTTTLYRMLGISTRDAEALASQKNSSRRGFMSTEEE